MIRTGGSNGVDKKERKEGNETRQTEIRYGQILLRGWRV